MRGGSDWNTEYSDIEGDKLILEMGSTKIVIIQAATKIAAAVSAIAATVMTLY